MSDPHPETLPSKPDKPPPDTSGELRMEVDHLLARVDDILGAFEELYPFSPREIHEVRLRSEKVDSILRKGVADG